MTFAGCCWCLSDDYYRHDAACPAFGGALGHWEHGYGDGIFMRAPTSRHPSYGLGHRIGRSVRMRNAIECGHAPPTLENDACEALIEVEDSQQRLF